MDTQALIALFTGVALLAIKPGPGMMTVASKAISEGIESVLYFMVGTNLVKILFFALVVFGYHVVSDDMLFISIVLKALTAVYLIWLGIKGLQKFDIDLPMDAREQAKTGFWENFSAGFMLTISNPFDILFFAGILPSLFDLQTVAPADLALAAIIIVLADAAVALSYALPLSMSRQFLTQELVKRVNLFASIGIILAGCLIGYAALPAWDVSVFE